MVKLVSVLSPLRLGSGQSEQLRNSAGVHRIQAMESVGIEKTGFSVNGSPAFIFTELGKLTPVAEGVRI